MLGFWLVLTITSRKNASSSELESQLISSTLVFFFVGDGCFSFEGADSEMMAEFSKFDWVFTSSFDSCRT